MLCRLALVWNLPPFIMATLKSLMADRTSSSTIDFRNNNNVSADGTLWANAWVTGKEGKLLCIGATVATLEQLAANPKLDTLMLTKPEPRVAASTGLEYDMCQLAIARVDFSFSLD
jgi:hypothetical protein